MHWFRLWNEFSTDPKIQSMPEAMQRRWVMVLCLHNRGDLQTLSDSERAFALHITDEELTETKKLFTSKGFIDGDWKILNWDKRQYKSDTSAERTRQYRERKKTDQNLASGHGDIPLSDDNSHGDVTVTRPDTDTDTESDTDKLLTNNVLAKDPKIRDMIERAMKHQRLFVQFCPEYAKLNKEYLSKNIIESCQEYDDVDITECIHQYASKADSWGLIRHYLSNTYRTKEQKAESEARKKYGHIAMKQRLAKWRKEQATPAQAQAAIKALRATVKGSKVKI